MNLKIIQPAGLGDLVFIQKICHDRCAKYDKVYLPIVPQYSYFGDYVAHPDNLIFAESPEPCETLDLQNGARVFLDKGLMQSKYCLAGVDMGGWQEHVKLRRYPIREAELISKFIKLGTYETQPFALICNEYATPPQTFRAEVPLNTCLPTIRIEKIPGDNPFDWLGLIQQATELHLVDSVFVYLAELIPTVAARLCIYPRSVHHKTVITKGLWKKPWEYVE